MSILEGYMVNTSNENHLINEQYLDESMNLLESLTSNIDNMSDDEILNENFIETFSDNIHDIITYITKGRETVLKESEEAAKQAYNYEKEVESMINDRKKKRHSEPILVEEYTLYISDGSSTIIYTETRKPIFTGVILDFKNVLNKIANMDQKSMKKWVRSIKTHCLEICRFSPSIKKEVSKRELKGLLTIISKSIDQNKKLAASYRKQTDAMLENFKFGKDMLEKITKSDDAEYTKNVIKGFKTLVNCQKQYYTHDSGLMHAYNKLIITQSRHIRDKLKKANLE